MALEAVGLVVEKGKEGLEVGNSSSLRALGHRRACHHPPPLCREGTCHLQLVGHCQRRPKHVALIQNHPQPMNLHMPLTLLQDEVGEAAVSC